MTTTPSAQDRAQDTAATATQESKRVGSIATDEVKNVASETQDQVRMLISEARVQVNDQTAAQRDRVVDTLRSLGDDLDEMASQSQKSGLANDLARQAAEKARAFSSSLDGRDPADLLEDVRSFARRKPGTFLLGALAAGMVAGRLARGARENAGNDTTTSDLPGYAPQGTGYAPVGDMDSSLDAGMPRVAPAYSAPYAADVSDEQLAEETTTYDARSGIAGQPEPLIDDPADRDLDAGPTQTASNYDSGTR